MQATADFTAIIDGKEYKLKKGDAWKGDAHATAHLKALGLIGRKAKDKESSDER